MKKIIEIKSDKVMLKHWEINVLKNLREWQYKENLYVPIVFIIFVNLVIELNVNNFKNICRFSKWNKCELFL
jgi:hypothetical protein